MTVDQIAQLFTGTVTDWSAVGGDAGAVACIGRESGSGTRDGFESITGTADACVLSQELTSTGAVIEAVKNNPSAIGYASLSAVEEMCIRDSCYPPCIGRRQFWLFAAIAANRPPMRRGHFFGVRRDFPHLPCQQLRRFP